jgi:hypothetical protein
MQIFKAIVGLLLFTGCHAHTSVEQRLANKIEVTNCYSNSKCVIRISDVTNF